MPNWQLTIAFDAKDEREAKQRLRAIVRKLGGVGFPWWSSEAPYPYEEEE